MAREPELYRENLEVIRSIVGDQLTAIPVKKAAELLGLQTRTLVEDNKFPKFKVKGSWRVSVTALAHKLCETRR